MSPLDLVSLEMHLCFRLSSHLQLVLLLFLFNLQLPFFPPCNSQPQTTFFPWLALRFCLSRFPLCSFSHYKAVFFGEHLLFSPVSFYLSCSPPHFSSSQSFFSPHDTREDLSMLLCIRQEETHFHTTSLLPLLWTQ